MRLLKWLGAIVVIALVISAVGLRTLGSDPARWHIDPTTSERTGRDNDVLIAPAGITEAIPDAVFDTRAATPAALLFQFDAIARNADRVEVIAGSVDDGMITYVQRSAVFGFPDYITVKAVEIESGAGLVIWSRARFGYSDMGVNADRIEAWLARMGG